MSTLLVYPHQLFEEPLQIPNLKEVVIVEEPLLFKQYRFHKQKLVFQRASMKFYQNYLQGLGFNTRYIESRELENGTDIFHHLSRARELYCGVVDDDWLQQKIEKGAKKIGKRITFIDSPFFLNSESEIYECFSNKYFMASFYKEQRIARGVLLEKGGKPAGGKWSFDAENRKKFPKDIEIPEYRPEGASEYIEDAIEYIEKYFPENPGELSPFYYGVTFDDARVMLQQFLGERLQEYGNYQDAIDPDVTFGFHSVISPYLNSGLLTPQYVIDEVENYAKRNDIPLNSLEGFIRQILGWREYVRGVYLREGRRERTMNFWGFEKPLPKAFYDGTTGIEPVDTVIRRTLKSGYAHHIERLMILGNFMLLCEINPDEVYQWFMELFIDAYDWVMVPNVYGMSQYADGGLIVTKPYISSSNYVRKMSSFKKGEWCEIWDGLYWRFIDNHRDVFAGNPRMKIMISHLQRMDKAKLEAHREKAERFLSEL